MVKEVLIKPEKKQSLHYVNNREFSTAVIEYVNSVNKAKADGQPAPQISNYIGECFIKICEGLSHKPNFIKYSYRDEMVMDAVENCVGRIANFDRAAFEKRKAKITNLFKEDLSEEDLTILSKAHGSPLASVKRWYREWGTGQLNAMSKDIPNAFSYFTQIAFFAFLRRIAKEQKQWKIKMKYIESASIGSFANFDTDGEHHAGDSLIAKIRGRTSSISHRDDSFMDPEDAAPIKKVKRGWGAKKVKATSTATLFD